MKFTHLDWDSDFFGKRIGKIEIDALDDEKLIQQEIILHSDYDLLYLFTGEDNMLQLPTHDLRCRLVDQKVVYTALVDAIKTSSVVNSIIKDSKVKIEEYALSYTSSELEELAYQSGEFSRFKTDTEIPASFFYKLYKEWIDKSINHKLTDKVYVAVVEKKIVGMVTVVYEKTTSTIGLLAVDHAYRGKHVGSLLLEHLKGEARKKSVQHIYVSTQLRNDLACKFYERSGFKMNHVMNIYHFWFKKWL